MKTKLSLTKLEKGWILYDIGNSAFILLVATLLPIYFNTLAEGAGISESDYLAYWGYAGSVATLLVAIIAPICGTLADQKGFKKPLFLLCLAYTDEKFELMKMNENLYPEMFDECTMYTSIMFVKEPENPLKLDYKVFRDFENIDFCIEMLEQKLGYYGCWKMHIFDKKSKLEIAVYG